MIEHGWTMKKYVIKSLLIHLLLIVWAAEKSAIIHSKPIAIEFINVDKLEPKIHKDGNKARKVGNMVHKEGNKAHNNPLFSISKPKNDSAVELLDSRMNLPLEDNKFKYSSFFDRVHEKLDSVWRMKAKELVLSYIKSTGRSIMVKTTVVIVQLDDDGKLLDIKLNISSGDPKVDLLALNAFQESGDFQNPPAELVKNGRVIFDWTFVIN